MRITGVRTGKTAIWGCFLEPSPCQPFSVAGKKLGTNDPRHLWPDIKRLITEIEPPICFFENVSNHLRVGFEEVANDLRQLGYQIKAGLFTAQEVGAPHKRERLFILAYSNSFGSLMQRDGNATALERKSAGEENGRNKFAQTTEDCCSGSMAHNNSDRCFGNESKTAGKDDQERWSQHVKESIAGGNNFAATGFSKEQNGFTKQDSGFALPDETKLADSQNLVCKWCEQQRSGSRKSKAKTGSDDNKLGNSNHKRLEGQLQCECSSELPAWPPSPSDYEGWNRVPNHLKPALHRMADGMADRVDRIRACGNGVVPLVAAYAW